MMPSDAPRGRVLTPCFNYGRFLKTCPDSVTSHQALKPIETVVIDHCSTYFDTLSISGNYILNYGSQIYNFLILHDLSEAATKIIRQENRCLVGARNNGVRHSCGDCVYFLDAFYSSTVSKSCPAR